MSKQLKNRIQLVDLLPDDSIGIEIGVQYGKFSEQLCKTNKFSILYSVDSWLDSFDDVKFWIDGEILDDVSMEMKKSWTSGNWDTGDDAYKAAVDRLGKYKDSRVLRLDQIKAANLFPDQYFDFVYIDSAHNEKSTKDAIIHWLPKVKPGGILAGDDYIDKCQIYNIKEGRKIVAVMEVKSAVDSLFSKINILPHDEGNKQWWIRND